MIECVQEFVVANWRPLLGMFIALSCMATIAFVSASALSSYWSQREEGYDDDVN